MRDEEPVPARILIVEDEAIVAMDIRRRIERLGYRTVAAVSSGEEALTAAREKDFDLALMDIQLDGRMDGIEAADAIRRETGRPVVYLTAFSDRESLERAKVTDAFGYVLKPFDERELGIAIEMAMFKERMQRSLAESREWLMGTVAALHEGVVTTDAEDIVLLMNRRAEELTGWHEAEATGRRVHEIVRLEPAAGTDDASAIVPEAGKLIRRDGSTTWVERCVGVIGAPADQSSDDGSRVPVAGRVVVLREVSETLRAEREMRRAREKAERALQTKSEFLANVTHEFRTPLNSILGMADLAQELSRDEQQREYLGILKGSAENLLALISSILDLSRIDAGHMELEPGEVNLDRLVESVVESFALEAHSKGLALRLMYDPAVPAFVWTDGVRLTQILSNLLANAVKYTEEGAVTVRTTSSAEGVSISINDTGPGIPASEQETVFRAFTQLEGGLTRRHGGAGIGLAVVRELTRLMSGDVRLSSREGEGSTFTLTFPLEALPRSRSFPGGIEDRARRILVTGGTGEEREMLVRWAREIGSDAVPVGSELGAVKAACDAGVDLVVALSGEERESVIKEVERHCGEVPVRLGYPIGGMDPQRERAADRAERYLPLSEPVTPSVFLRALVGAHPEAAAEEFRDDSDGNVDYGVEVRLSELRARFPVQTLEASRLAELADVVRDLRATAGDALSGRRSEVLFRLALAARRGDVTTARRLLGQLG
ncbi:MAG: ATP-binding protein [Spirochaetaceae bacterium]